jgi:hypothetical protein
MLLLHILFSVLVAVAFLSYLCLLIIAATIFRDYNFPKNAISINNRYVCTLLCIDFHQNVGLLQISRTPRNKILKCP